MGPYEWFVCTECYHRAAVEILCPYASDLTIIQASQVGTGTHIDYFLNEVLMRCWERTGAL